MVVVFVPMPCPHSRCGPRSQRRRAAGPVACSGRGCMVGGMAYRNPPPNPPEGDASGPAREWLARERQRAEAASRSFAPAGAPRAVRQPETTREKQRKTDWRVGSFFVLFGSFVVRPITGWWPELVIGLAALGAYFYLVRRYRAYRQT